MTGNKGDTRGTGGAYIPALDPTQISINYLQPGTDGIPVSTGTDPQDIYETDFAPPQRNIFRQSAQKQLNLSLRKQFNFTEKFALQYEFNVFNVTNTTSLDVPMNQGEIRQNYACSNYRLSRPAATASTRSPITSTTARSSPVPARRTSSPPWPISTRFPIPPDRERASTFPPLRSARCPRLALAVKRHFPAAASTTPPTSAPSTTPSAAIA